VPACDQRVENFVTEPAPVRPVASATGIGPNAAIWTI
jgi:hypothetical protein